MSDCYGDNETKDAVLSGRPLFLPLSFVTPPHQLGSHFLSVQHDQHFIKELKWNSFRHDATWRTQAKFDDRKRLLSFFFTTATMITESPAGDRLAAAHRATCFLTLLLLHAKTFWGVQGRIVTSRSEETLKNFHSTAFTVTSCQLTGTKKCAPASWTQVWNVN